MSKKLASIFAYLGIIFWLISFLVYPDKAGNSKNLSQGLIVAIIFFVPGIGTLVGCILALIAIVKILQGEEDPELPVIGGVNFFNK